MRFGSSLLVVNCPRVPNNNQSDLDDDGHGDVCDNDMDGDGHLNEGDNCPQVSNRYQRDVDDDGIGAECDPEGDLTVLDLFKYLADYYKGIYQSIKYFDWLRMKKSEMKSDARFTEIVDAVHLRFKVEKDIAGEYLQDLLINWLQESKSDFHDYLKWRYEKSLSAKAKQ